MKMTIRSLLLFAMLVEAIPLIAAMPVQKREILSEVYTIDRVYRSMEGPGTIQKVYLEEGPPELLWLVGVRTQMVGEDGRTPQLPEFMCHVNVDIDPARHQALFAAKRALGTRMVTLSQGILGTRLPDGFGFPIASNEPLILFTQVLNHNIPNPKNLKVRHRVTFEYVRDRELKEPIRPLINIGASGTVLLDENPIALSASGHEGHHTMSGGGGEEAQGSTCLMAPRAPNAAGTGSDYVDPKGRKLTGHWVVPPGRQVNHSDVGWFMGLPYDAKMHYAAVHLHPFAESLTLRDVTTGKDLFIAKTKNPKGKVGLDHVDTFKSAEGLQLFHDHEYQLISVYNNTTKENHDSMASMFLGVEDREFVKPSPQDLEVRAEDFEDRVVVQTVMIKTSAGDIGISLLPHFAPRTARQFARLIRKGVLDGAQVALVHREGDRTLISFTAEVPENRRRLVQPIPQEGPLKHERAILSFCPSPESGRVGFDIVIGPDPSRDGRCTVFGEIGPGAQALRAIAEAPRDEAGRPSSPIRITGVEVFQPAIKQSM